MRAFFPIDQRSQRAAGYWARRALAVIGALIVVAAGALAAQAAMLMLASPRILVSRTLPAPAGAGAVPVAGDPVAFASPARGTTGTAPLPAAPAFAARIAGDAKVTPARPFTLAGVASIDRARALECLSAAIYYEAASESDEGQRAVAQVVLNRVRHPAFPASVCGVVYQGIGAGTGAGGGGCQFSFACDGASTRVPSRQGWAHAARIAAAALNGSVYAPVGLATHYHTFAVTPAWNRTLVMTDAVGAHFFHRWKGFWGTAAAFVQRYRGGELLPAGPVAAPEMAMAIPVGAATPAPVAASAGAVTGMATPVPAPSPSPSARAPGDRLSESPILDRWKDSGKPLR
ncbi:cell wall hydrolase [Sphingomonas sp.]|uniref:cell wall hydrolase n=1 Tax=Sphingomonas sp. TaxID=28214 RepID=UPI00258063EF|nr:cell wall hydrolase [Sphingomonas sp.]